MKTTRREILMLLLSGALETGSQKLGFGSSAEYENSNQVAIPRVEQMPNIPQPFKMRDWRQVARDFDAYVFDLNAKGPFLPLVWIDKSHINFDEDAFGLYVTVADPRMGPKENSGEYHDSICDLPAVIGATLAGIDKSNQKGRNWVSMCKGYFNKANGRNVVMESSRLFSYKLGGACGDSFWCDTLPNILFAQLVDYYPQEPQLEEIMRTCADQFYRAVLVLKDSPKGFHYRTIDFKTMTPIDRTKELNWIEPDSSASFAWLEYMAYAKFRDPKYLQAAKWAMDALDAEKDDPLYDCILPFGAYLSARMNAEQRCNYDTARIVNWCFAGGHICVGGVIAARWGDYDLGGLVTMYDDRPYLFETFQMAASLVPLTRYDPRLARAIGKWMLNAANNARLFYPEELPDAYQATPELKSVSRNLLAYEVLLGRGTKHLLPSDTLMLNQKVGIPFVASRDPWESWSPATGKAYVFPEVSHFSIYSSSPVGIFGGIISRTDDEKILQLDCLKTDFFHDRAYPTYLYFNPHAEDKEIHVDVGSKPVDLYDTVSKRWLNKSVHGSTPLRLPKDSAVVIVLAPAGGKAIREQGRLLVDGVVVDYQSPGSA